MTISFQPSTETEDINRIRDWQSQDHSKSSGLPHRFWLTGSDDNPLTCKVCDDLGVVLYLRMDKEGSGLRMHTLFLSDSKEGRKRIAALLGNHFMNFAQQMAAYGDFIVFESKSPHLTNFMMLLGFRSAGGNDYCLPLTKLVAAA